MLKRNIAYLEKKKEIALLRARIAAFEIIPIDDIDDFCKLNWSEYSRLIKEEIKLLTELENIPMYVD